MRRYRPRLLVGAATVALASLVLPVARSSTVETGTKGRYLIVMRTAAPLARSATGGPAERARVLRSQNPVAAAVRAAGGRVLYRYAAVLNGLSAELTQSQAASLARRSDVARVQPVGIVRPYADGVSHIGADQVWHDLGYTGKGITVAVVDTGTDYTHAAFGGEGTEAAYNSNDPTTIEPGTFPTKKVVGGYDFVGDDYDVLDQDPSNDEPDPDPDPLDPQGHGTHTAGTCCGSGAGGKVPRGVAYRAKILSYKVWGHAGASTSDVLVAAFERAVDPNSDGDLSDRADVLSFSGGVDYGTADSLEALAAQGVVDAGTVFVAAAGNAGNFPFRTGTPASAPGVLAVGATTVGSDVMAAFSSGGPSRVSIALKPEVVAPGVNISSAGVGSGDGAVQMSGTSMAAPHVSGIAALLLDRDRSLTPEQVKSLIVTTTTPRVTDGGQRPPASLMGSGRVRAFKAVSSDAVVTPSVISFGAPALAADTLLGVTEVTVENLDAVAHRYRVASAPGYSDFGAEVVEVGVSTDGVEYGDSATVKVPPGGQATLSVRFTALPSRISAAEQVAPWYSILPEIDGSVVVRDRKSGERLRVPWYVSPTAASAVSAPDEVTLDGGSGTLMLSVSPSAGTPAADLYPAAGADPQGDLDLPFDEAQLGEADIVAFGARPLVGDAFDGQAAGLPEGHDALEGLTWKGFVTDQPDISEPIEFAFITAALRNTPESSSVTFYIDAEADGVYENDEAQADYLIRKRFGDRTFCVENLSMSPEWRTCDGDYPGDYQTFNTNVASVVVDASGVGLFEGGSAVSFYLKVCSDPYSGDVPQPVCDLTDSITFDALAAPVEANYFCGGFWSAPSCSDPIELSGAPGDLLVLFPNNPPSTTHTLIPLY